MNKKEYLKLVKRLSPKEERIKNSLIAFLVGGLVGLIGEIIIYVLIESFGISRTDSFAWLSFILILFTSFMTAIGKFDNWVSKAKCGLIIPTTGFAHSVQSAALDYKRDGLITGIGSNMFKLAGSVIVYGIISSFFLIILKVMLYG
jgi:stage V sporulation protein AC